MHTNTIAFQNFPVISTHQFTSSMKAGETGTNSPHLLAQPPISYHIVDMPGQTTKITFNEAFETWMRNRVMVSPNGLASRVRYIGKKTETDYRQYARALAKMFGNVPIDSIDLKSLNEYHRARAFCDSSVLKGGATWAQQAGPNLIRKEIAMLIRIMKSCGVWTEQLQLLFQPVAAEEQEAERPLSINEQSHLLAVAASREQWSTILHYIVVALQTTCSTNELRALRLGDISLEHSFITIRSEGAKNKFRIRTIPLESREVHWSFERLMERARSLGASANSDYLFPFRLVRNLYDPTRPMGDSALKKPWEEVRTAAGLPWLRLYDLRHTAITRMAEAGVPIPTIMSFSGHVSVKMQQHYTSISMMAKRKAMASVWSKDDQNLHRVDMGPFALRSSARKSRTEAVGVISLIQGEKPEPTIGQMLHRAG